ncbi:VCBS repeat-containing protein [Actinoplanes sp. TBRC 11911]|uniref:DNRLRE domain-containing protein n=1 Tax=Actinoplanes sp. TBRC 11911 TaxID=2729386 RepID=UPI00145CF1B8|nr:DNRLRE domain-containing protein [Actinoplanes sp. TBRC 11911]NMO56349.1 VCBS repeat-containing protein [Actinoplanes sp. TBRC 11911]
MTAPRLLSRTRLTYALGLLLAASVTAASVAWWPDDRSIPDRNPVRATPIVAVKDLATAMAEASRTGKQVLVDTETTATSRTWARPDGQLHSEFHAVPQRARTADGRWQPIDNTLRPVDGTIRPVNPYTPVRFSAGSEKDESVLAEVDAGGHTITYTWPGKLPAPVLDGSRALYPEVRPGVDLLTTVREEGGFGQLLIVKNAQAAADRTLSYGLSADGAVFRRDATTGGVHIYDAAGTEIGSIPTPMAWDASGRDPESPETPRTSVATSADVLKLSGLAGAEPGSRQAPMPTTLDGDGNGHVRLSLDAAGLLRDPAVRFPLFLDPTINAGEQAWLFVSKSHPNSNFMNGTGYNGGTTDARVGHEDETGVTARSFWRMAYANIKGAKVSDADFKVLNNHSWSCTTREMQLYQTGAISTGNTWNKQPAWSYLQQKLSFAHGYNSSCADAYVSFNVMDAAQRAADAGSTSITLGLRASSEGDTLTWRKFQASTATLEVDYNRPPAQPTDGTTTPGGACVIAPATRTLAKTNIVLKAKATDPDKNLSKLRFRFWATTAAVPAGTLVTPDSAGWASLTIPTTSLTDKVSYNWDVRAEDSSSAVSDFFPTGTQPCRITVDASAPPAPDVTSDVFKEATPDGATWATVKFGATGPATFESAGATRFTYSFEGVGSTSVTATNGVAIVPDLKPRHSGPNGLQVIAYDAVGNPSPTTNYTFYVPPSSTGDGPGDTGGDGIPDLIYVNADGDLRNCVGDTGGELYSCLSASYSEGGALDPKGHWFDPATGKTSLIAKYGDAYPGDGITDLFVRHYDGSVWLYPGDGYGSFNVDQRLKIFLPSNAPAPSTWTKIKAIGDITGDKLPDLAVQAGTAFWILSGYTGASFKEATLMEGTAWALTAQELVNVADIDLDGTPDLLYRILATGVMNIRHGKPGAVAGSVSLDSLKTAAASRQGTDTSYGTSWTPAHVTAIIAIPDVNNDRIPDMWARFEDGQTRVYYPSATNTNPFVKIVLTVNWSTVKTFA